MIYNQPYQATSHHRKHRKPGPSTRSSLIEDLSQFVKVAAVDRVVILHALRAELSDFKDAVQEGAAKQANISTIVTRNETDFTQSKISANCAEINNRLLNSFSSRIKRKTQPLKKSFVTKYNWAFPFI